jgi:putative oxidoreductase
MTNTAGTASAVRQDRTRSIVAWALQVLLALAMAGGGAAKLAGDPVMVQMFDDIGSGQWLRPVVGFFEVAGGVGLLIPRLRALAALGLIVLLGCATITNLAILHVNTTLSVLYAVVAVAIFVLRRSELRRTLARPARPGTKSVIMEA